MAAASRLVNWGGEERDAPAPPPPRGRAGARRQKTTPRGSSLRPRPARPSPQAPPRTVGHAPRPRPPRLPASQPLAVGVEAALDLRGPSAPHEPGRRGARCEGKPRGLHRGAPRYHFAGFPGSCQAFPEFAQSHPRPAARGPPDPGRCCFGADSSARPPPPAAGSAETPRRQVGRRCPRRAGLGKNHGCPPGTLRGTAV